MKRSIAFILNSLLIIFECIGLILAFRENGPALFVFYTQLSNIVLLAAAAVYVYNELTDGRSNSSVPKEITYFKYIGTSLVTVTLLVVIFVLVPFAIPSGKKVVMHVLFGNASLYHHVICPILALISFLGFEEKVDLTLRQNVFAVIPTLTYAVVLVILNLLRVVTGPYPFLMVYDQPVYMSFVWAAIILGIAFLIALVLRKCKKQKRSVS